MTEPETTDPEPTAPDTNDPDTRMPESVPPDAPTLQTDDYLARVQTCLRDYAVLLQGRLDALARGAPTELLTEKELREVQSAINRVLKEEGVVRDERRKRLEADGTDGLDMGAAREQIECRMARLRELARSGDLAGGDDPD